MDDFELDGHGDTNLPLDDYDDYDDYDDSDFEDFDDSSGWED